MSRRRKTSVFIDSSILIAAAISETGAARELLRRGFRNQLDLYLSSEVLEETERNLSLRAPEALDAFTIFRDLLQARVINPSEALILKDAKIVVPKDALIVAAAAQAQADYLATHDRRHLLNYKKEIHASFGLTVASPDEII